MDTNVVVLDERRLRARVKISREAMGVIEAAFAALGRGGVVMPPVLHLDLPERNAEVDVKTAYVPGLPSMALKVSTGFFDNPGRGLPSLSGMMALISAETGRVEAVLLDNGYLTDVRTALAGAVAADRLARADARVAGIIGTGLQARMQLEALRLVRPIERVLLWGRDRAKAEALALEIEAGPSRARRDHGLRSHRHRRAGYRDRRPCDARRRLAHARWPGGDIMTET